jgi:hypothetical protein
MCGYFAPVIAIAAMALSVLPARSDEIPTLDVRPVCRGIASQSADPGVGQGAQADTFQRCSQSEQAVREQLKQEWSTFSAADKRHCVELAKTGGESSNTELLTCLEMSRDVRVLRSAAASNAAAETTKLTSSPSTPTMQPTPAITASQPASPKEPSKAEGASAMMDVERAKAEAQTAKASEASVKRKLAEAETALQRAKEEAGRATAEAERATATAQAAKESEAAAKRNLADAEAARLAAEQACSTHSGFGRRLKEWFKRPGSENP